MLLYWAKIASLISLAAFLGFGCYLEWTIAQSDNKITAQVSVVLSDTDLTVKQISKSTSSIDTSLAEVSGNIQEVTNSLNKTLISVNRLCVPGPCGTLADIAKSLNTIRGTFGQIEIAANHEDKNLTTLDSQEAQLFSDTHSTLVGFIPIQNQLDKTIFDADTLVTSPDVNGTLHNIYTITYNVGQTSGDFQNKFHSFLYPPVCKGFRCHLAQDINYIKIGSQFVEPTYWGYELLKAIP